MSTNFPSSLDTSVTLPAESASTPLSVNHVVAHQNIQDALEAVEAKIGVDSSAVTTSHDYKLGEVTSSDRAVGKTATQTLTNKTLGTGTAITLGSDAEGDTYYRNAAGVIVRLARGTDNYIYKMNGNVPNWEAETVTNNASTTVAGIVEEAIQSEVDAGTTTGATGARLFVNPSTLPYYGFGSGSDGDATIASGNTTLTTDKFYNNLTIQTGGVLIPNGFRIFVRGTLTFEGTGKIQANGGAGGTGGTGGQGNTNASGGTAGVVAQTAGSLPQPLAGGAGGAGATGASGVAGSNGTAGTSVAKSLGAAGVAGGAGATGGTATSGTGPGTGGTAGSAGSKTGTVFNLLNSIQSGYLLIDNQPTITTLGGSASSGGGAGGGGGRSANSADCGAGGGGGGSGAPGGFIWLAAKHIVTVNGNTYAEALGGAGGAGGAGGNSTGTNGGGGSGGGGGGGGSGGIIIIYYASKSGTGTESVTGGAAGTGGALGTKNGTGTDGTAGSNGTAGATGSTYVIAL
jgi:hypothetical protein